METDMVEKLVREIADELFTVCTGAKNEDHGNRLAIMKGRYPNEKSLGGRNRVSVEEVLRRHLSGV